MKPNRTLRLGWAETTLPDGVGLDLSGFLPRENPSIGQREPLYARALWVDDGRRSLAWASVDVLAVPWSLVNGVRVKLTNKPRRSPQTLSICATHTHSAPAAIFLANCGLVNREWEHALEDALVGVIAEAAARADRRVRLRYASTDAPGYSYNRRSRLADGTTRIGEFSESEVRRRGPLNTALSVLVAHEAATGRPLAAVVHFACHPVFYCDQFIGADWPGWMIPLIRERMGDGFMAMFAQGACGDVNPRLPHQSPDENAARMGAGLAEKALECITDTGAGTWLTPHVRGRTRLITLPWRSVPKQDDLTGFLLSPAEWTAASRDAQARHLWARRVLKKLTRGWWAHGIQSPVQMLSFGELAVACFGAEVFSQTAIDLAAEFSDRPVLVAGYANDDVGYLPPAAEFPYGGYEIERAYRYYGYPEVFAPEAEQIARELAASMIGRGFARLEKAR